MLLSLCQLFSSLKQSWLNVPCGGLSSFAGSCFGSPVKENFSVSLRYLELNALNEGELFTQARLFHGFSFAANRFK